MADKKFSIVIPVHNSEKTLAACLDSCIGQSYRNIEIFCVDDYSTDTSPDILKQYAEKDNRLRFISLSENVNSYMARKIGLQYVTGDYILFLDSDDTLVPDACETIDGRLHGEEIDIVEFGYTCIPGGNMMLPPRSITLKDRLQDLLSSDPHLPSAIWTLAYKRQLLLLAFSKTRDFNAFMAEDVYISIIVLYYAKTFMTLNKPLVNYSTSGMSNTKTLDISIYKARLESYAMILQHITIFFEENAPEHLPCRDAIAGHFIRDFLGNIPPPSALSLEERKNLSDLLFSFMPHDALLSYFYDMAARIKTYRVFFNHGTPKIKLAAKYLIRLFFHSQEDI